MGRWTPNEATTKAGLSQIIHTGGKTGGLVAQSKAWAILIADAHNADCDAYEMRIAELEEENIRLDRKRFENVTAARKFLSSLHAATAELARVKARIAELEEERDAAVEFAHATERAFCTANTELARVKAESLRVVPVGEADYCVWCDGSGSWLESEYESGGTCVGQLENACIHCLGYRKPVRLERWEDEG